MGLSGVGASKGVAIGKVFIKRNTQIKLSKQLTKTVEEEQTRVREAQQVATNQLGVLYEKALKQVGEEEALIFDVHQMLVQDLDYTDFIMNMIADECVTGEYAVSQASTVFADMFASMEDKYMQERAADIQDISKRLVCILTGVKEVSLADIDTPSIVVAKDLLPSDTIQMNKDYVIGFITEDGGKMSHSAILARTMQIPAIVGAKGVLEQVNDGEMIIIDGKQGSIYINPTEEELNTWTTKKAEYDAYRKSLEALKGTKNMTKDGVEIEVNANIGSPADIKGVLANDAKGVGLFRSEFLYMDGDALPTEEEQFEAYKKVLEAMEDRVIIRTLDVGGDKEIPYLNIPKEENPFLGYRAIRVCLDQVEMFKTQLRALLRASLYGKLGIMFPMIISVTEIQKAKALIEEVKQELASNNIAISDDIEIGVMIETPAAVLVSDLLAKEVDFFSIGTNDLTQYTLAVDRMNSKIADLYDVHNPAVLRAIKIVADNAHKAGIWIGICGESAADTTLTETYIAMGIDELSVSAGGILELRQKIQSINAEEAKKNFAL
ncbi:MAG: phosphoenolpyruvate--protein phosphotransferase [Cellulosilyticaceae bacterium]